jgi:hypothetical protein
LGLGALSAQTSYFFPDAKQFNQEIPTPAEYLGYEIGDYHTRYDQLVNYFKVLAEKSDRVQYQEIGQSIGKRPLVVLTITDPGNFANLETIRQNQLAIADPSRPLPDLKNHPAIVFMAHNVHGNEASSGESALMMAYFLAANQDPQTLEWLKNSVILLNPVLNPDGRDRFNTWVNMHRGSPFVSDPLDREHTEVWPGGRGNHYWFDLNRDWYLVIHPELRSLIDFYHQWMPNVVTDFHEMGTNSTYFFEPAKLTSGNPLVPKAIYEMNDRFATFFAKAFHRLGSLYFTREVFDGLYPGYGSSYPDLHGSLGLLFEQGSSRGHVQDSPSGKVTFAYTIRNQVFSAMATLEATAAQRENLFQMQRDFFRSAVDQGTRSPVRGYVFGDATDPFKNQLLLDILMHHRIRVQPLEADVRIGNKSFIQGKAWAVYTNQPQYRMVQSIFETLNQHTDSVFYDASTWNLPYAMNMPFTELRTATVRTGPALTALPPIAAGEIQGGETDYAYLLDIKDFRAYAALYALLNDDMVVKVAFKPFSLALESGIRAFGYGTVMVPVQPQKGTPKAVNEALLQIARNTGASFTAVKTGFAQTGIDLGSNYFRVVEKPKVLMLVGNGVVGYEAGEVWHLLDTRVKMPVAKVDIANIGRVKWQQYNTLVMVNGNYNSLDPGTVQKIKRFVADGGTLIAQKGAAEWALKQGLLKEKLRIFADTTVNAKRADFDQAVEIEGSKNIGGTIFEADVDLSHPLGFGFSERKIAVYKNSKTLFETSKNPYSTVVQYTQKPLISGYINKHNLTRMGGAGHTLVGNEGSGRVIVFADNPNFRAVWLGTSRLFVNALFFGQLITQPSVDQSAE